MTNYAVRYHSRSGNTKKVADAIAHTVGTQAYTCEKPLKQSVDVLFLGGAVYAAGIDDALKNFIKTLQPELVGEVAVFSTAAIKTSAYPEIKRLLNARGISVSNREFHCRGKFTAMHRNHPNDKDLEKANNFAKEFKE